MSIDSPSRNDLPPFDPTRPSIGVQLADGSWETVNREKQFINIFITLDELISAIGLPVDHRAIRVVVTEERVEPAIILMLEGPSGHLTSIGSPIMVETLNRFRDSEDDRRKSASAHWLREAVMRKVRV